MKEISLTQEFVTQVDDWNYDFLNQWNWYVTYNNNGIPYVARNDSRKNNMQGKQKRIYMHRVIMKTPKHLQCDHIHIDAPNNTLNNQEENLRNATRSQNRINSNAKSTTGYRGVSFNKLNNKYQCRITINRKEKHLGYFDNPIIAAQKYDRYALKYHGEYAVLNFK